MLIRRSPDEVWREPAASAWQNEDTLQQVLESAPELLPGSVGRRLVAAREVSTRYGPTDLHRPRARVEPTRREVVLSRLAEALAIRPDVLALEPRHVSDGDVELLIPNAYGTETVRRKAEIFSSDPAALTSFKQAIDDLVSDDARR